MRGGPTVTGVLIFFGILFLIDLYVFSAVKTMTLGLEARTRKYIHWAYWITNAGLFAWCTAIMMFGNFGKGMPRAFMTFLGVWILLFVPKLVVFLFIGAEDVVRGIRAVYAMGYNSIADGEMSLGISRRQFLSRAAGLIALIPVAGIAHGMISGKFRFRVRRETIYYDDLPPAFDGFTITQLSDTHVGSFDPDSHREEVREGLKIAQDQNSDLMVFTGDLVNNLAEEMHPWKNEFGKLRAPFGQFSILGNHDYGDYYYGFEPSEAKEKNFNELISTHSEIGFRLMRNEHTILEKDGQQIYLLGVENWGHGFKQEGKLEDALTGIPEKAFKILLSHDPTHFEHVVSGHETDIHLTLSGHTHGAQFGVEIPGFKWSPVQMRYSRWAGLYNVASRYIYINRGFGFLAFPGRVGIWPEITVITLKRNKQAI